MGSFGVWPICKALQIAPSTYSERRAIARDPDRASARAKSDAAMSLKIDEAWEDDRKLYGASKIWHVLRRDGEEVARCTVERWGALWRSEEGALAWQGSGGAGLAAGAQGGQRWQDAAADSPFSSVLSPAKNPPPEPDRCGCGGIGRRAALRSLFFNRSESSSLFIRTNPARLSPHLIRSATVETQWSLDVKPVRFFLLWFQSGCLRAA